MAIAPRADDVEVAADAVDASVDPPPYGPLPVGSSRQVWARRPADEAEAKAMASSLRLQILRLTLHEPRTNKEIATALDRHPASVLHHVRTLVDTGFLIAQPVRRGERGAREVPYLASGKSWYLENGAESATAAQPASHRDDDLLLRTFLAEVGRVGAGQLQTTRLGFRLSADEREEFFGRLTALLNEIAARPSDPDAEPWSLFLALHPEG